MITLKVLAAVIVFTVAATAEASNILLIPFKNSSHFMEIDGVARPLVERGHKIYLLLDDFVQLQGNSPYQIITYKSSQLGKSYYDVKRMHQFIDQSQNGKNLTALYEFIKDHCVAMMGDSEMFPKLHKLKLDLVIVDNFYAKCFFLIPYKLGVPFVTVGSLLTAWYSRLPILPSVVQQPIGLETFGITMCEETPSQLTLVRSLCRLGAFAAQELLLNSFEEDYLRQYVDFPSISEIRQNMSLSLFNYNHLLSSSPLPKLPNVEYVGGLTTRPAKPLEASLDKWMSLAPNVIVVSFGSMFPTLPAYLATKLFDAFSRMPQYRFLFRFKQADKAQFQVSSNVRLMDWLPQNDALGHNSTVLFVTHSGNNGQQEAFYHGVPMLCFYIHADQTTNAKRVVSKGFGKMVGVHEFTADQLVSLITELLHNQSYANSIKKASAIFRSEKHPALRAADAVEHVLKYGADHLRPKEAYKLRWWQFYMLDVLAVVYVVCLITVYVVYRVTKFVVSRLLKKLRSSRQQKTKSD